MPGSGTNSKRQHYGRFDEGNDIEFGLETLVEANKNQGTGRNKSVASNEAGWEDSNSDRAIVQTTTTAITYSTARDI